MFVFIEAGNVAILNTAHFSCLITYETMNGGVMRSSNYFKELGAKMLLPPESNTESLDKTVSFVRLTFL